METLCHSLVRLCIVSKVRSRRSERVPNEVAYRGDTLRQFVPVKTKSWKVRQQHKRMSRDVSEVLFFRSSAFFICSMGFFMMEISTLEVVRI